jgi:hypothetical protein
MWGDTDTNAAASDPKFIDANNASYTLRNYNIQFGSAAIGMAYAGGDVGVFAYIDPAPSAYLAQDTFTRSVTGGWGSANVGGAWTVVTTASNYDVNGTKGTILLSAANVLRRAILASLSVRDVTAQYDLSLDKLPTGNYVDNMFTLRNQGTTDLDAYGVNCRINTTGVVQLLYVRRVNDVQTLIAGPFTVAGVTYTAGMVLNIKAEATGANPTTVRARCWASGSEPATWLIDNNTDSTGPQGAGGIGFRSIAGSGATNAPYLFSFDNLLVSALSPAFLLPSSKTRRLILVLG